MALNKIEEVIHNNIQPITSNDVQISPQDALVQKAASPKIENLAFEILKLGAAKEAETHAKINKHLQQCAEYREQIHTLLELSSELNTNSKEFSEKAKALFAKLKESAIDLCDPEKTVVNKERITELKSEISSRIDRLKSEVNITLSTKVNYLVQTILSSVLEMMKKTTQEDREAKARINERMRTA